MKLVDILNIANEGYPDGFLAVYYHPSTGKSKRGSGDTLAQFIVREIQDTYDPDASDMQQLAEARRVMSNARREVESVIDKLEAAPGKATYLVRKRTGSARRSSSGMSTTR